MIFAKEVGQEVEHPHVRQTVTFNWQVETQVARNQYCVESGGEGVHKVSWKSYTTQVYFLTRLCH